ncbi:MAG TPA: regulator, partial [Flavobacteriaceae bacterium]|nr:regulator [Flavobacteriaceae bacterium]
MLKNLLYLALLLILPQYLLAQTPCSGGMAGSYPCNGITLQSYISAATMGAAEGQDSWGWTDPLDGKEYAIVALDNGTAFVDITNPVSPTYLGRLNTQTGSSLWRDVKVFNNHAYIVSDANGNHGMQIFDLTRLRTVVSPPVSFTQDGWETWGTSGSNRGRAHNIIINEDSGYAYVSGVSPYISGGLVIFNLNIDPKNPTLVATYSAGGYCHDAQVVIYDGPDPDHQGKEILIGSFSSSDFVRILGVTNKASITQIGVIDYTNKQYTHQGWFTEDKRFFIVGDELDEQSVGFNTRTLVFDLQDLDNPVLHYIYNGPTPAIDHNGYVRDNRYYLANYSAGMRILKVDGLYAPTPSMTEVNYFDTYPATNSASFNATWNVYPYFDSGNLIATGFGNESVSGDGGLFVLRDPNYDNADPVAVCQNITATLDKTTGTVTIDALDVDGGSTDN